MKNILVWVLVVIGCVPAIFSLTKAGFYGASDEMHIAWIQQMDKTIDEGQIPPRYVPDLSYGFGYPLYNFISPLPYYLGVGIHRTGASYVDSFKTVLAISVVASAVSMFLLAQYLGGNILGVAASLIYTYSPYRATDLYVRGALGESVAFIMLPVITLAVLKIGNNQQLRRWIGIGALGIGALVLSHNIVSFMFLPMVAGLILINKSKNRAKMMLMTGLGLIIALYFWLPALVDSRLMKYDPVYWFYDHFPSLKQLLIPYWGYGGSVPGNYDTMSFFIGEINLVLLVLGLILGIRKRQKWWIWTMGVIAVSMLMMNFRSYPIWEKVPMLDYFQFPWRFLTMVTFGTTLLVVALGGIKRGQTLAIILGIGALLMNLYRFKPQDFFYERSDSYFLNRYIPVPAPSNEYKNIGEEYLRLPKNTKVRPEALYPEMWIEGDGAQIRKVETVGSFETRAEIETISGGVLNFRRYNFPGWQVSVNGSTLIPMSGEPWGQISVKLNQGLSDVTIKYQETRRNRMLGAVSLAAAMGAIGLVLARGKKQVVGG